MKKWAEYQVLEYVTALREKQKEDPAPLVLRSKMYDLAVKLYADGYTCLEISKLLSIATCTVYRALRRKDVFKPQDRSIDKEIEKKAMSMYREGQEASTISELLNITIPSVRWILKKNKVPSHILRIIVKKEKPGEKILEQAVRMYQEGIPYRDITIKLDINHSQLYNAIHKSGVPLRGHCPGKTKQRVAAEEEAIRLYRDTDTYVRDIEKKTGIAYATLKRRLKARNIPIRCQPLELTEDQKEEVARLYKEGWTNKAIAKKTGIGPGRFSRILKEKNIPLKGPRRSRMDQ